MLNCWYHKNKTYLSSAGLISSVKYGLSDHTVSEKPSICNGFFLWTPDTDLSINPHTKGVHYARKLPAAGFTCIYSRRYTQVNGHGSPVGVDLFNRASYRCCLGNIIAFTDEGRSQNLFKSCQTKKRLGFLNLSRTAAEPLLIVLPLLISPHEN